MESKVKILCNNHRVCPEVMITLGEMGFTRIKDVSRESVSFDITAKRNFKSVEDERKTIHQVFDRCKGKVHQIEVSK
ncbi:MAG: hypothetical protein OXI27_06680 [Thaumarchaeota archaeon]|nr:hypothetical protein [Nitrososphaerota archaeon]MDE0526260.1 hypothetical protein [Nitrososphaerota archaeon]